MKILVTGAGGFLGSYVVDRLLERGHDIRAIVRPASHVPNWNGAIDVFRADLRNCDNLVDAFKDIDAVLHLASATSGNEDVQFASTVVATERFLDAMAESNVKRLVHVSSLVVYDWARAKGKIDENTPLLDDIYEMGGYTIAKVWQERVVLRRAKEHAWAVTIMRPGFIWGKQHTSLAGMGRKFGKIYLMFGPFTRLPLTHVQNCADCLVAAVERPAAAGESFNVIDSDAVRVWRYVREYANRTGLRGFMVPLPYQFGLGVGYVASLISRILYGKKGKLPSLLTPRRYEAQFKPVRFSSLKLKTELGWTPSQSFEECLDDSFGEHRQEFEINSIPT